MVSSKNKLWGSVNLGIPYDFAENVWITLNLQNKLNLTQKLPAFRDSSKVSQPTRNQYESGISPLRL
jgi:hypothetical protein